MVKVSVIIPVYNAEKYLEKCLDSVINQTLKEIEIICIDDCSTDNSYSILKEYIKKDNRIVVFKNKTNHGAGYTRNVGLNFSKGEYIGFVDSDDYIDEKYYEELYNTAKKYDPDMVSTPNMGITKNKDLYDYEQNFDIGNILHLYGYYKMHSYRCGIFNWSSCNRLLKRCFIIRDISI